MKILQRFHRRMKTHKQCCNCKFSDHSGAEEPCYRCLYFKRKYNFYLKHKYSLPVAIKSHFDRIIYDDLGSSLGLFIYLIFVLALLVALMAKPVEASSYKDPLREVRMIFHSYYVKAVEKELCDTEVCSDDYLAWRSDKIASGEIEYEIIELPPQEQTQALYEVVMAEAGNQPDDGIRMVCDVVLNRAREQDMTIKQVIAQKNQFSSYSDGGIEKWKNQITDDVIRICDEELRNGPRYANLYYFRTGHYCPYGTPAMKVGAHYFSYM